MLQNWQGGKDEKRIYYTNICTTFRMSSSMLILQSKGNQWTNKTGDCKQGKVKSIRISTRPDYIDKLILKRLKKYHVQTIELGVQSANDYILARCQRGHTFEDVKKASKLIRF